jgi:hypothetical protein
MAVRRVEFRCTALFKLWKQEFTYQGLTNREVGIPERMILNKSM